MTGEARDPTRDPDGDYQIRPDALHRYGALVLTGVFVVGLGVAVAQARGSTMVLGLLAGVVLFGLLGVSQLRRRLVIGAHGLAVHGLGTTEVRWTDVASYRVGTNIDRWEPSSLSDYLVWPVVALVRWLLVAPIRAVARWIFFGAEDRRFLDTKLSLRASDDRWLTTLSGESAYLGVGEAAERIVAALHRRRSLDTLILPGEGAPSLAAVTRLEIEPRTTLVEAATGGRELATDEIPNLYQVIAAVRDRGGTVAVDRSVWLPRALRDCHR